jgi:protein SCO1
MHLRLRNKDLAALVVFMIALLPKIIAAHEPSSGKSPPGGGAFTESSRRIAANLKAPQFTGIDQDDQIFISQNRLHGKIVAINFIYTTCSDVCPLFTVEFARLQRALKSQPRQNFFLVSITTDPEIDTPKVLKAYAQRFDVDFDNWAFLTGNESQVKKAWKAFGVQVIRRGRGLVQHTNLTTLIDAQGSRRINFFGPQWQFSDFLKDMRALSQTVP